MERCLLLLNALFWLEGPTICRASNAKVQPIHLRNSPGAAHPSDEDDIVRVRDDFGC